MANRWIFWSFSAGKVGRDIFANNHRVKANDYPVNGTASPERDENSRSRDCSQCSLGYTRVHTFVEGFVTGAINEIRLQTNKRPDSGAILVRPCPARNARDPPNTRRNIG